MRRERAVVLGAGQVGTFAAWALTELGLAVHVADLRPDPGFFYRYGPGAEDATLDGIDIRDRAAVERFLARTSPCRALVLCAGLSGDRSLADPQAAREVYRDGTANVLAAARQHGVARTVFVSSLAVYGAPAGRESIGEGHPIDPPTEYGAVLAEAESVVREFPPAGTERIIVRSAGAYGPNRFGMGSHSARFFERIVYSAARREPIRIRGTWEDSDDYIYVKDLGRGIALAATGPAGSAAVALNLGTGAVSSLRDVVEAVTSVFPAARITVETPENARPSRRVPLDVGRAHRAFGFRPRFTLAASLEDFAAATGLLGDG